MQVTIDPQIQHPEMVRLLMIESRSKNGEAGPSLSSIAAQ